MLFAPVGDEYACLVLEEAAEALLEDVISNLRIDLREKSKTNSSLKQGQRKDRESGACTYKHTDETHRQRQRQEGLARGCTHRAERVVK